MSPETSAIVVTAVIMIGLAFISFKIGQKIADKNKD